MHRSTTSTEELTGFTYSTCILAPFGVSETVAVASVVTSADAVSNVKMWRAPDGAGTHCGRRNKGTMNGSCLSSTIFFLTCAQLCITISFLYIVFLAFFICFFFFNPSAANTLQPFPVLHALASEIIAHHWSRSACPVCVSMIGCNVYQGCVWQGDSARTQLGDVVTS